LLAKASTAVSAMVNPCKKCGELSFALEAVIGQVVGYPSRRLSGLLCDSAESVTFLQQEARGAVRVFLLDGLLFDGSLWLLDV